VSSFFAKPTYQSAINVPPPPGATGGRGVPDVCGNAAAESPYPIFVGGQDVDVWGTSAVAPLWAGLAARLGQRLGRPVGFLNTLIYQPQVSSSAFRDITSGNNNITGQGGPYSAGSGWDPCTGLGSPRGAALLSAVQGSAPAPSPPRPAPSPPPGTGTTTGQAISAWVPPPPYPAYPAPPYPLSGSADTAGSAATAFTGCTWAARCGYIAALTCSRDCRYGWAFRSRCRCRGRARGRDCLPSTGLSNRDNAILCSSAIGAVQSNCPEKPQFRRFSIVSTAVTPISVIIPVRNEGDRIIRAIQSIVSGRSCPFPLELVIVDDNSTDRACDQLLQAIERTANTRLVLRRLNSWSGIPFARNRGAELASYPIYFITDGNTLFLQNWDLPIWGHFERGRILAATILDVAFSFRGYECQLTLPSIGVTWIPIAGAYGGYVPVVACTGTVIDRELFHRLGGYDETLPLYGAAEPEFSVRAWLSGYEIVNVPQLPIYYRFRPRREYDTFYDANRGVMLTNYLRFACYYLPENLLAKAYEYYHQWSQAEFNTAMSNLDASDVWIKRAALSGGLPLNFQSRSGSHCCEMK